MIYDPDSSLLGTPTKKENKMKRETFFITEKNQSLIESGIHKDGGGQSSRLNGMLERYQIMYNEMRKEVKEKFKADIPKLIKEYAEYGKPGPWIREYALRYIDTLYRSQNSGLVNDISDLSPFHKKFQDATPFEILVLEEIIARKLAITFEEKPVKKIFSKDIQALRIRLGLTQKEIATIAEMTPRNWQRYENEFAGTTERIAQQFDSKLFGDLSDPFMISPKKERENPQKKPRLFTESKVKYEVELPKTVKRLKSKNE